MEQLEDICPECKESKFVESISGNNIECPRCNGTGLIPSYYGEKVLSLILHNLKSLLKELAK